MLVISRLKFNSEPTDVDANKLKASRLICSIPQFNFASPEKEKTRRTSSAASSL